MTKTLYLEDSNQYSCSANIIEIYKENDQDIIILDQSIFYPQGGGQPSDTGIIKSATGQIQISKVSYDKNGKILHIGQINDGAIKVHQKVECQIDNTKRDFHKRLHSSGHLIDLALRELGYKNLKAQKGYHFPDSPYVQYEGVIEENQRETMKTQLENKLTELIKDNLEIKAEFMNKEVADKICKFGTHMAPAHKELRVVSMGELAVPCGGTHVNQLAEIIGITIRKISCKKGSTKIAYQLKD